MLGRNWNDGDDRMARDGHGDTLRNILAGLGSESTAAEVKAMRADERFHGQRVIIAGALWRWHDTTAVAGDDLMAMDADDLPTLGAWLLAPGQEALLSMPIGFATADAAALLTVPAGALLIPRDLWWTISADFTGGSSSAIGVSATVGPTTKGDLLGGAAGDVAGDLEAADSPTFGTIGALWDTVAERRLFLAAATVLRFDQITSAFTAGAGTVEMLARVVANAGE